jgi:hypothetical protein
MRRVQLEKREFLCKPSRTQTKGNMGAKGRTPARAKAAAKQATTVAKERTPVRAKAAAQAMAASSN